MNSLLGEDERGAPLLGSRPSKSAEIEQALGLSGWDVAEEDDEPPRPVTALASFSVPTKATKPLSRGGGRKLSTPTVSAKQVEPMDGWGDFDNGELETNQDREDAAQVETPQEDDETVDSVLPRRRSRIETLARHRGKPTTAYAKEPSKQISRQRMLVVMELAPPEAAPSDGTFTPLKSVLKKPLGVSQRRRDVRDAEDTTLPIIQKSTTAAPPSGSRTVGLFGPHIDDSLEMREQMRQRFLPVWSLLPSRPSVVSDKSSESATLSPTRRGSASSGMVASDTKSPFECSMVLTKICKAVGISLTASPPPDVWSGHATKRRRGSTTAMAFARKSVYIEAVTLETFAEFVVRHALQPAMHHFRLDRDATEYLHTLDAVVHSLVARVDEPDGSQQLQVSRWRLRELGELQPVLPLWKRGTLFMEKQPSLIKTSPTATAFLSVDSNLEISETVVMAAGETVVYRLAPGTGDPVVIQTPERGASRQSKKLSAHEARAMQDANIRRKMQLRKSWQPRIVVSEQLPHQQQQQQALTSFRPASPLGRVADPSPLDSCIRGEAVPRPHSFDTRPTKRSTSNNQVASDPVAAPEGLRIDEPPLPARSPLLLLCGSCPGEQEASLWCSACFAVYCSACWTATHHSTVDLSAVNNQHEPQLPTPTARPMRTQRDHLAPPVDMVYLPTKPLSSGKLRSGPSTATNQLDEPAMGGDDDDMLTTGVACHAILPAIKPRRQKPALEKQGKHHRSAPMLNPTVSVSAMDSTANLLKALMLGTASSASVLGSTSSPSPWSTTSFDPKPTTRVSKEPTKRLKFYPKAVALDATALFP